MPSSSRVAPPARVVTISISGCPAARESSTRIRLDFLLYLVRAIRRARWHRLDAVVLPAGYLRTAHWFAGLPTWERRLRMDQSIAGETARVASAKLEDSSPGCNLILGIDTHSYRPWGFRGDQAAAVFRPHGCVGVIRKVFPVDGDTNEWGRAAYLLDRQDAWSEDRFIDLPNGGRAMMALCYDTFVFSELALGPTGKLRAMRYQTDPNDGWAVLPPPERHAWLDELRNAVELAQPTLLLNPIHGFVRPRACGFWQRHGLASASAYLDAPAVGAAHFKQALPTSFDSWLAAAGAPYGHLALARHRRAHSVAPISQFELRAPHQRLRALLRLFEL